MRAHCLSELQGQLGCTARVISVLLLKCRDQDKRVQLSAYELLASVDSRELHDRRDAIDAGLGVWHIAQQPQGMHLLSDSWSYLLKCGSFEQMVLHKHWG